MACNDMMFNHAICSPISLMILFTFALYWNYTSYTTTILFLSASILVMEKNYNELTNLMGFVEKTGIIVATFHYNHKKRMEAAVLD